MNKGKTPSNKDSKLGHLMFQGHLQITIRVIGITLIVMALCVGIGYYLDQWLETGPILMVVGVVAAFPIIQLIIYRTFRSMTNQISENK